MIIMIIMIVFFFVFFWGGVIIFCLMLQVEDPHSVGLSWGPSARLVFREGTITTLSNEPCSHGGRLEIGRLCRLSELEPVNIMSPAFRSSSNTGFVWARDLLIRRRDFAKRETKTIMTRTTTKSASKQPRSAQIRANIKGGMVSISHGLWKRNTHTQKKQIW